MTGYIIVLMFGAAVFAALVTVLAAKPSLSGKISAAAGIIAAVGGLLIYGYGFLYSAESLVQVLFRSVFAVCCMFVAEVDFSLISDAPLFQYTWAVILYWAIHLLAFYATASAAVSVFGADALKRLRLWLSRRKDINIIYGLDENSLELGRIIMEEGEGTVLFVAQEPETALADAVDELGALRRQNEKALAADCGFLESLGIGGAKRRVNLYAVSGDTEENLRYAGRFLASLEKKAVPAESSALIIHAREEVGVGRLQQREGAYGFGNVSAFQPAGLAARMLVRDFPPCEQLSFNADAAAAEDFSALIVGFGRQGQEVLKSVLMSAQFEGSRFSAAVFDPDWEKVSGYFFSRLGRLTEEYDISFHAHDARSREMYKFLNEKGEGLKYIVLCTGNDRLNAEISGEFAAYFGARKLSPPIYLCSCKGVKAVGRNEENKRRSRLYHPDVLSLRNLDGMAKILNHYYTDAGGDAEKQWADCDYFSRMSSRASADFIGAMIFAAGKDAQEVKKESWKLSEKQLENLGRTEHRRWCAFHYCMGFRPMTETEFKSRAAEHAREKALYGKSSLRVAKDMEKLAHACLIPWEALEELDRLELELCGREVNYKEYDMENVRVIPELLALEEKHR